MIKSREQVGMAENEPEVLETLGTLFQSMALKWANHLHEKNTRAASLYLKQKLFDNYFTDLYMITRDTPKGIAQFTKYYKLTENLILDLQWYVNYRYRTGRGFHPTLYDLHIKVTAEDITMFKTYFKTITDTIKSDINAHTAHLKTRAEERARFRTLTRKIAKKITLINKSIAATELKIKELTEQRTTLQRVSSKNPKTPQQFILNLNDSNDTTPNATSSEIEKITQKLSKYNHTLDQYTRELGKLRSEADGLVARYPSFKTIANNESNNNNSSNNSNNINTINTRNKKGSRHNTRGRNRGRSGSGSRGRSGSGSRGRSGRSSGSRGRSGSGSGRSGSGSLRNSPFQFQGGTRKKNRKPQ